jgi:hypothetical protein
LWLLLWTPALSTPLALAFIIPFALVVGLTQGFPGLVAIVFVALMSMVFAALLLGVGLYLLNLPFVLLAVQCPLYGDRFRRVLRLPAATASEPGEAALGEAADGGEE